MRIRTFTRLTVLGLATYGGYTLWNRYGSRLGIRAGTPAHPDRRIRARAKLSVEESAAGSDDPVAQAAAILADSDERARLARDAPGVERRQSQDTVDI